MLALLALSLAAPPLAYIAPDHKMFPNGRLVVTGIPNAKIPRLDGVREPALSPDKTRVLFWVSGKDLDAPVKELNLRTGTLRTVATGNCRSPGWSPDGKWIFFTRFGQGWNLMIQPASGGKAKPILGPATRTDVFSPVWSAGNASIVAHDMTNVTWVYPGGTIEKTAVLSQVMSDSGLITSAETFTDRPGSPTTLAFTQDSTGAKKLGDTMTGMVGAVYTYDTKTKKRERQTPLNFSVGTPRWSADGEWLYFSGRRLVPTNGKAKIEQGIFRMRPGEQVVELVAKGGAEFSL